MIYLITGNEYSIKKRKIDSLIKDLNIPNIIRYDFEECSLIDILNEASYVDLFNEQKLIVVSYFSMSKLKSEEEKAFVNYINSNNSNVIILNLKDDKLDNRKNITKILLENSTVINIDTIEKKDMTKFFLDYIKGNGYNIDYDLTKRIVVQGGYNTDYIFNEIEKLLLYKIDDKNITSEDISKVVSKNTDKEMYELINAVMNKDISMIFKEFKIVKELNIEPLVILASLAKEFNNLLIIKLLKENNASPYISRYLNMNIYVLENKMKLSDRYSLLDISDNINKLFEIDELMKNDDINGYKLLERYFLSI